MSGCLRLSVGVSCLPPLYTRVHASPPAVFPLDSGIDFVLPHTLISAGSVTDLPLGIALDSASQSYTTQVHLPRVCGAVLCLCPAGSCIPPPFRNGIRRWAKDGLTTGFGFRCIAFLDGLEVFLVLRAC